jgi:hypothetical protein
MYPVQLRLAPAQRQAPIPSADDVTAIGARARNAFVNLEHIRIRAESESILLTMFIVADSSAAAATISKSIARHIVETEPAISDWRYEAP